MGIANLHLWEALFEDMVYNNKTFKQALTDLEPEEKETGKPE